MIFILKKLHTNPHIFDKLSDIKKVINIRGIFSSNKIVLTHFKKALKEVNFKISEIFKKIMFITCVHVDRARVAYNGFLAKLNFKYVKYIQNHKNWYQFFVFDITTCSILTLQAIQLSSLFFHVN